MPRNSWRGRLGIGTEVLAVLLVDRPALLVGGCARLLADIVPAVPFEEPLADGGPQVVVGDGYGCPSTAPGTPVFVE